MRCRNRATRLWPRSSSKRRSPPSGSRKRPSSRKPVSTEWSPRENLSSRRRKSLRNRCLAPTRRPTNPPLTLRETPAPPRSRRSPTRPLHTLVTEAAQSLQEVNEAAAAGGRELDEKTQAALEAMVEKLGAAVDHLQSLDQQLTDGLQSLGTEVEERIRVQVDGSLMELLRSADDAVERVTSEVREGLDSIESIVATGREAIESVTHKAEEAIGIAKDIARGDLEAVGQRIVEKLSTLFRSFRNNHAGIPRDSVALHFPWVLGFAGGRPNPRSVQSLASTLQRLHNPSQERVKRRRQSSWTRSRFDFAEADGRITAALATKRAIDSGRSLRLCSSARKNDFDSRWKRREPPTRI